MEPSLAPQRPLPRLRGRTGRGHATRLVRTHPLPNPPAGEGAHRVCGSCYTDNSLRWRAPMAPVLALYEDVLSNGAALALPAAARMVFLVHGSVTVAGRALHDGEAWHGE